MLNHLVELSLRYKVLVLIIFAVIAFLGLRAVRMVPIDAFPDVTPVQVSIYTESPGLAAEDVEQLLTFPVESAMAGLPKVQEIRSVSLFGLSFVSVYFEDDMDIYFARQLTNERLQEVGDRLPEGYGKPSMGPNASGLGQVLWYTVERAPGVTEEQVSDMDLRTLQDWTVRLILRTAPGVDDVTSWGGGERQYQVRIDPQRLYARGLGFGDVLNAIPANNGQVGGNVMDVGREQYLVRGLGLLSSAEDIGAIVLKAEHGVPVYLRDVATVVEAPAPRFGAVTRDGEEVVLGMALARIGENAKNVVDEVTAKLATVSAALPEGVVLKPIYQRTDLVNKAVGTATTALIEGSLLVALVLFLFLGELRSALVVIVALPLAMLIAFIGMQQFGLSANLMSLAGLAIGIGMMVDGAVVMVENAFRLMAERQAHGERVNRTSAVLAAAKEVANPIAFAIVIIIVVFLPLFALEGLEGKLFKPMAFTIAFAMGGSLILSLTLIPVLASLILKPKSEKDTRFVAWLKRRYRPILEWALARKGRVLGIALVALAGSLALFPFLGKEFMPQLQEGSIMWRVTSIPSTSLDESIAVSKTIAEAFKRFPEVETTLAMIGRAEKGETADVNYMEIYTALKDPDTWDTGRTIKELEDAMQETLEEVVPTTVPSYTQPIQMRVEELISGVRATLALKLYGRRPGRTRSPECATEGRPGQGPGRRGPVTGGERRQAADPHRGEPRRAGPTWHERRRGPDRSSQWPWRRAGQRAARRRETLRHRRAARGRHAGLGRGPTTHSVAHRDRRRAAIGRSCRSERGRRLLVRTPRAAAAPRRHPDGRTRPRRRRVRERGWGRTRRRGETAAGLLDRMGWCVREPAAGAHKARGDRAGHDLLHLPVALHGLQLGEVRGPDPRQRAVRDARRHRGVVHHRAVPVGPFGHRLHRRVRRGHAERHRAGQFPERAARQGVERARRSDRGHRTAAAAGADDRECRDPGPGADAAVIGRRRRNAATTGHRRRRRAAEFDPAHPGAVARAVRMAGNARRRID